MDTISLASLQKNGVKKNAHQPANRAIDGEASISPAHLDGIVLPVPSPHIPVNEIHVPGEIFIAAEHFSGDNATPYAYTSKVFRGGFHLRL
jgi:hypothetical protein